MQATTKVNKSSQFKVSLSKRHCQKHHRQDKLAAQFKKIAMLLSSALLLTASPMLSSAATKIAPLKPYTTQAASVQPSANISTSTSTNATNKIAADVEKRIRQTLADAGIKVAILSIEPSKLPNMYRVNLQDQPPLHITADAQYLTQGELQPNPSPLVSIPPTESKQPSGTPISAALRQSLLANMSMLKNMNDTTPLYYTAVPGVIWGATSEGVPFLVSADGKYFSEGEIVVIRDGQLLGLDGEFEKQKNRNVFANLDEKQLVNYPAKDERAVVYVATDINCPYCRRFHRLIPELNAKGITVKVIGYPAYDESFVPMRHIWCEQNDQQRKQLLDDAMLQKLDQSALNICADTQTNLLQANRNVAAGLAVLATPAIYRADGEMYQDNFESAEFLQFLGVE